jgi:uncharacterized protein (DUF885 family)
MHFVRRPNACLALLALLALAAAVGLSACNDAPATGTPARDRARTAPESAAPVDGASRSEAEAAASAALALLTNEYFQAYLKANPIAATAIGDDRYNDRLVNILDPVTRAERRAEAQAFLDRAVAIDRSKLTPAEQITYDVFVYGRRQFIDDAAYPSHLLPLTQFFNLPALIAQLGSGQSLQPFVTTTDYRHWLSRLADYLAINDQMITNMREGMKQGIVQPRVIMEKTLPQLDSLAVENVEDSILFTPVRNFPDTVPIQDRAALAADYRTMIGEQLLPAFRKLRDFVATEYLPATRDTVAWTALPGGAAWYEHLVRMQTTTDLTAAEIHDLGRREVARILDEMRAVRDQVDFDGDLAAFFEFLSTDPRFRFESEDAAIRAYEEVRTRVTAALPTVFEIFPRATYEIRPVEAFRAASAAGASYQDPSSDGSRPGVFYLNTHDLSRIPVYITETLSLHEAEPGHHFQSTIQQEMDDLPDFRRFGDYYVAYGEGWALYAESLGPEMGLLEDPYQYYGKLSEEQLRALRLVVDTGLHAKGWTREEAIAYMHENSSMSDAEIVAEVERYIAIPGQALGYKIGQLKILELRARAEAALGEDFDIKAFHTALLDGGAVPLSVLNDKIDAWIRSEQTRPADGVLAHRR